MGFDADRFMGAGWQRRQGQVKVPDLADWFDKGEQPVWQIQSLEAVEIARAREAERRNKTVQAVLDGMMSKNTRKKADAIREYMGVGENVPDDIAYRTEVLRYGSVAPPVDYPLAAALHKARPIIFYEITNEILKLTGLGHEPGKAPASGKKTKSAPR